MFKKQLTREELLKKFFDALDRHPNHSKPEVVAHNIAGILARSGYIAVSNQNFVTDVLIAAHQKREKENGTRKNQNGIDSCQIHSLVPGI